MPIILSQTYEIVTEESAAEGDAAERGFDWEDAPHTFRETVELIQDGGFIHPSCYPGVPGWLSTEADQDVHTGEYETKSLHPGKDARSQRYWEKACRAAGVLQDWIYWRDRIKGIHANGYRVEVTYKTPGGVARGLATHNATKGVGPSGVWFVCVDNFVTRIPLTDIIQVKKVTQ